MEKLDFWAWLGIAVGAAVIVASVIVIWCKREERTIDWWMAIASAILGLAALVIAAKQGINAAKDAAALEARITAAEGRAKELAKGQEAAEQTILPRFIEQSKTSAILRQYKGVKVILATVRDDECEEAGDQLAYLFKEAGWEVTGWEEPDIPLNISPGIVLQTSDAAMKLPVLELHRQLESKSKTGASTARADISKRPIPAGTIKVTISKNRPEYFELKKSDRVFEGIDPRAPQMVRDFLKSLVADDEKKVDSMLPPEPPEVSKIPALGGNKLSPSPREVLKAKSAESSH